MAPCDLWGLWVVVVEVCLELSEGSLMVWEMCFVVFVGVGVCSFCDGGGSLGGGGVEEDVSSVCLS